MPKMTIAAARKIVKDSRYSAKKKRLAREVLRESGSKKTNDKSTAKSKTKKKLTRKVKAKTSKGRTSKKKTTKAKKKTGKTLRRSTKNSKSTKTRARKKTKSRSTRKTSSRNKTGGSRIKFYDVATKRHVSIPRSECSVKRSKKARGGDQLVANYKGRKLFTFVKKGFKL